jgi:hypothetical protein
MARWESTLAYPLPAESAEDLLFALVVRDLLHGSSYDVEVEEGPSQLAVDFTAGDELEGAVFRLIIEAEVEGAENHDMLQELTEQILEDLFEEAERLVEDRTDLGQAAVEAVEFRVVPEDEERWDLVIPEWLAPDEAEVPFGFRPFRAGSQEPWPSDAELAAHGRVVVVPHGGVFRLFGVPAPPGECGCGEEHAEGEHPHE